MLSYVEAYTVWSTLVCSLTFASMALLTRASLLLLAVIAGWFVGGIAGFVVGLVVDLTLGLVVPGAPGQVTTGFWLWMQLPGMVLGALAGAAFLLWWLRRGNT